MIHEIDIDLVSIILNQIWPINLGIVDFLLVRLSLLDAAFGQL